MTLFGSGSNDNGCTAHHYPDEWELDWDNVRVDICKNVIVLHVGQIKTCQHDGCGDTKHSLYEKEFHVPKKAVLEDDDHAQALSHHLEDEIDVGELDEQ